MRVFLSRISRIQLFPKAILWFFLLFLCLPYSYATEAKLDSLYGVLSKVRDNEELAKVHMEIANQHWNSNPDSAFYHLDKVESIILKTEDSNRIIDHLIDRSVLSFSLGHYDKSLETLQVALQYVDEITDPGKIARVVSNMGNCYTQKNELSKAIMHYRESIGYLNEEENLSDMAVLYGRLGNLYYQNRSFTEGIDFYKQAIKLFVKLEAKPGEAISFMNIGNCYKQLQVPDSAVYYYNTALTQFKALGNMQLAEAQCLANLGNIHSELHQTSKALKYLLNADSLFNITQNIYSIAQINSDIANLYIAIEKPSLAKPRIDKCLRIAKQNDYSLLIRTGYRLLWKYYDQIGDCTNAYEWLNKYSVYKDSLDNISRQENIDLLLTQFETERKEKEIEILKQSEEINQLKLRRKSLEQYITFLGLIVVLAFAVSLYFNNRRRKRLNKLLTQQNAEISQQKEEIISQRDEIENQRDMLQDQNHMLEQFHDKTTNSLRYAQSIQAAILPSQKVLQQISPHYFVLMKPCELVSGDFYWATCFDEYQIFCVADCTGHGVPGAFMSILGITALNDIIVRHRITKPSDILGHLRSSIIETLSQNDIGHLHKDGLDIALCTFNMKTRELQYSGAKVPLWIVSEDASILDGTSSTAKHITKNGVDLFEVRGDNMPVGQSPREDSFTNHIFSLKGTSATIYLATDGFADQIGEKTKSKYGSSNLKTHIISISTKPFQEQKELLSTTFDSWMGSSFQVDDVTILGIKL